MKTFTQADPVARDYATPDAYNTEASSMLAQFNGAMSADQLPYEGAATSNFVEGVRGSYDSKPDGSNTDATGIVMTTQAFYHTQSALDSFTWDRDVDPSVSVLGPPRLEMHSDESSWASGIVPYSASLDDGVYLRFPTKEGMLRGNAQVDLEYFFVSSSASGFSGNYGASWRWQLYVFVDNVMVATTGPQPAGRRRSVNLPFAVSVSAKDAVEVDIRWSATFDGAGESASGIVTVERATLRTYNTQLWVRHQYR